MEEIIQPFVNFFKVLLCCSVKSSIVSIILESEFVSVIIFPDALHYIGIIFGVGLEFWVIFVIFFILSA